MARGRGLWICSGRAIFVNYTKPPHDTLATAAIDNTQVHLISTTLQSFRNYRRETLAFHERFNLILGGNGHGKTNLLEAVHMLATTRPFSQQKMEDLITFGEKEGRIKGEFETGGGLAEVHITLREGGRTVRLNGKVISNAARVLERVNVVCFLPTDMDIVKGSPTRRRAFMDTLISGLAPAHLGDVRQYHRALAQRNKLLLRYRRYDETVQVWDKKLAELGAKIIDRRSRLVKKLEPLISTTYRSITRKQEEVSMDYECTVPLTGGIEDALKAALEGRAGHDASRGHTTVGPHRDQPELKINGRSATRFASQGEAKTLAISLRAAEVMLIQRTLGRDPILLVDELTSELDESRKQFIFGLLDEYPGQIFFTSTSPGEVAYSGGKRVFEIEQGHLKRTS